MRKNLHIASLSKGSNKKNESIGTIEEILEVDPQSRSINSIGLLVNQAIR